MTLIKRADGDTALDNERRLMKQALARLVHTEFKERPSQGRLVFGLDLTASREATLDQARIATSAMFDAISEIGKLSVKLAFYRGSECKESPWYRDAAVLRQSMLSLSCHGGHTQIGRLLRLVLKQTEKPSAAVFIGDHCEEDRFELWQLGQELKKNSIPLFIFHECNDGDGLCQRARPVFERIAQLSGGAYVEFTAESGAVLLELLTSVAAFSTAGSEGLERITEPKTVEARHLREHLLLGSGALK